MSKPRETLGPGRDAGRGVEAEPKKKPTKKTAKQAASKPAEPAPTEE